MGPLISRPVSRTKPDFPCCFFGNRIFSFVDLFAASGRTRFLITGYDCIVPVTHVDQAARGSGFLLVIEASGPITETRAELAASRIGQFEIEFKPRRHQSIGHPVPVVSGFDYHPGQFISVRLQQRNNPAQIVRAVSPHESSVASRESCPFRRQSSLHYC